MANQGKKATPPTVTVKLGTPSPRHFEQAWVVRVNGEVVEAYPADDAGKRAALRKRDNVLAAWKSRQRKQAKQDAMVLEQLKEAQRAPATHARELL